MANFRKAMAELSKLEFSSSRNFLHKNPGEPGYTVGGIYQTAHPRWGGWSFVSGALEKSGGDIKEASSELYHDPAFRNIVSSYYKANFWDTMRLDDVDHQNTAEELFVFGVNAGQKTAVIRAQEIVGAVADGVIGPKTIKALNDFDEDDFDMKFDESEIDYYDGLIRHRPALAVFKNGWRNRANAI
jgi:hypothetical protein